MDQLHAVKAEHGLKASAGKKEGLVAKLVERFRAHRQTQAPAGKRALEEAVAGKPGFHNVREVVGGHAVRHGPTGSQVRADHAGTRFDVLTSGSTLHSSHATAAAAVKAAEASDRFGTGQSTAEQEHAARQEAIANAQKRAATAPAAEAISHPGTREDYERDRLTTDGIFRYAAKIHMPGQESVPMAFGSRKDAAAELAKYPADQQAKADIVKVSQPRGPARWYIMPKYEALAGTATPAPAAAPPAPAGRVGALDPMTLKPQLDGAGRPRTPRDRAILDLQDAHERQQNLQRRLDSATTQLAAHTAGGRNNIADLNRELDKAKKAKEKALRALRAMGAVGFSVAGALSPGEAEERAALRRVESYADRENARLRAVREGVGA